MTCLKSPFAQENEGLLEAEQPPKHTNLRRRKHMQQKIVFVAFLLVTIVILSRVVMAEDLSGTVYSQGTPIANLSITVKENQMKTKTGPKGNYTIQLPPGNYTLIIRESEIPVTIPPAGQRFDINL
jgi:hypothetical protein